MGGSDPYLLAEVKAVGQAKVAMPTFLEYMPNWLPVLYHC